MKRSTAKPYEGNSPYLFVSYCHKDRRFVFPIIESLVRDGYRIWYDEGINPGSDWNEVIADHMNRSGLCLAFISENAAASHNCRREINFALLKNKPLLSVFLEETVLTPGMEMQLSANQCVFLYTYSDFDKFLSVIVKTPELKPCLGEPEPSIEVRSPSFYEETKKADNRSLDISDVWFGVKDKNTEPEFVLIRKSTGEIIELNSEDLNIGRNAETGQNCYVISGNGEISRKHFAVLRRDGDYFVLDYVSKNGTFLNETAIPSNTPLKLYVGDSIRVSTEIFIFQEKSAGGNGL